MTKARDLGNLVSLNSFFADGTIQASEITGLAASATIDTTNASNITSGTIAAARLPSYVDDVLEFANFAALPATGETGKIYVALDTNKTFRWSGSAYIEISPAPAGGSNTQVQYNSNGLFAGSANMTFNGTRLSVADFADASLTSGRVTYATTGGNLTDSANLTFSGSVLGVTAEIDVKSANNLLFLNSDNTNYMFLNNPASSGAGIGQLAFLLGGVGELMRLTSTGLGIGTSSPSYRLDVSSASTPVARFTGATNAYVDFSDGTVTSRLQNSGALLFGTTSNHSLLLRTNSTTQATLDTSGNLGLGVTPGAWTTYRVMDIGGGQSVISYQDSATNTVGFAANALWNGSWVYRQSSVGAARYQLVNNAHQWFTAPSSGVGGAGTAATFTQAMMIDGSGNLGVGETAPAAYGKFVVTASGASNPQASINSTSGTSARLDYFENGQGRFSLRTIAGSSGLLFYDTFNGAERARITSGGDFGIGTTGPSAKLTVAIPTTTSGTIARFSSPSYDDVYIAAGASATSCGIGTVSTSSFNLYVNSSSRVLIDNSGNVGIGIVPGGAMSRTASVANSFGSFAAIANAAGTGDGTLTTSAMRVLNSTGTTWQTGRYEGFAHIWGVGGSASASSAMTLDGSGNLGIGVTSMTGKLDVRASGTAFTVPAQANIGGSSSTRQNIIGVEPGLMLSSDINGSAVQTGTGTVSMGLQIGYYATNDIRSQVFWSGGTPLTFTYASTPTGSVTERLRITSGGNLCVGTTSSAYRLGVTTSSGNGIQVITAGATTNNPSQDWYDSTNLTEATLTTGNALVSFGTYTNTPLAFITNNTERVRVSSGGNFGIGTTSPQQPFVVSNGGALGFEFVPASGIMQTYNRSTNAYNTMRFDASDILFFTGSPSERMRITSAGRVGINTQAPASTLGVDGRISLGNSSNYWPLAQLGTPTFHISPSGNDTTGDGSYANPWATLGKALAEIPKFLPHSVVGATIVLKNGTYTVGGDVYIRGFNGHGTIQINAETSGSVTVNFSNWGQFYFERNAATFEFNGITFNTLTTPRAFYINSTRMVTFNNNCAINQQTQSGTNEAFNWIIDVNDSGLNLNCPLTVINPSSYGAVINVNGFSSAYFGPNGTISKSGTKHPNAAVCINQVSHAYFQNTINNFTIGINMGQSHYDAEYAGFAIANNLSLTNCTIGIRLSNNGNFKNYYTASTSGTTTPVYWANGWYSGQYGSEYAYIGYNTSVSSSYRLQVNSQIYATSSTIATSDGRFKENVQTLSNGLDLVMKLRPVQFDWKEHPVHNFDLENTTVGFIAQEVQTALADTQYVNSIVKSNHLVIEAEQYESTIIQPAEPAVYNEYGVMIKPETPPVTEKVVIKPAVTEEFLGIAEGNLVALLTKAIQELKQQNDTLAQKVAELESKIG